MARNTRDNISIEEAYSCGKINSKLCRELTKERENAIRHGGISKPGFWNFECNDDCAQFGNKKCTRADESRMAFIRTRGNAGRKEVIPIELF